MLASSNTLAQPRLAAQALAGDAASPEALGQLARRVAKKERAPGKKDPRKAVAFLKKALTALRERDYQTGAQLALKALEIDETSGTAWHVLAIAREKAGHLSEALLAYEAALKLLPDELSVASDLGRLAQRLGYLEIAEKLFLKCLAANPGDMEVTNNLACIQRDQGRYGDAVETLRNLLSIEPESALLWNTLGTVLSDQGEMEQSVIFFDEALRLDAGFTKALYNRANVRMALGAPHDALRDIRIALTELDEPSEIDTTRLAQALTEMIVGDLESAFESYEARFSPHLENAVTFVANCPRLDPMQALEGRHILVFGEQGLGDEVLFANVLPDLLEALGPKGRMTLAVEPRLIPLMARSFPEARVVPHRTVRLEGRLTRFPDLPEDAPPAEAWTPMASLFRRFRRSPEAFPPRSVLKADPARVLHWRTELERAGPGPRIGVVWKSLRLEGARRRSFSPFELWRPVLTTPGAIFVNLQYGDISEDLAQAAEAGVSLWTPPGIDLKDDLDDLAALTCALDLMIGPANATTNIGAACGAPWWAITTPDAWPCFGTGRYPTYPSARVFPIDGFGKWEGVMARLQAELGPWIARAKRGGNMV